MSRRRKVKSNFVEAFEDIRADYDMSRESRFVRRRTGLAPQGNSADYHYRVEQFYHDDIEKARDMDRNDSIVSQTVTRAVDNIVQEGFTLEPQTGDKQLDNELWSRWKNWAENPESCDAQGEFTFHDFERFSCRACLVDGDIVHVGTEEGVLQPWEAHQIRSKTKRDNTVFGVTMDGLRRRTSYWLIGDPVDPNRTKDNEIELPVRDEQGARHLFHVYNPRRVSQTRGVTAFAPIFAVAGMRDDIDFAMLVQRQVASCFAIFRKRQYLPEAPHFTAGYGEGTTETTGTGETRYIENIAPGMEVIGQPGEELQGFSPDIPGGGYEFQLKTILQTIGTNLGLPLCLVLMDGSETNFSGWRGAVDEASKGFKSNQRNLIKRFHEPVYRWKVRQWMAEDAALNRMGSRSDINLFGHKWSAPIWQYIDPVGDAQGDQIRLQNGLISPRRLHAERGRDWETLADETIADMEYAISRAKEAARRINVRFQDSPVHWREPISLPMPNGIQMTMQDPQALQAQAAGEVTTEPATELTQQDQGAETTKAADTALNGAQVTAASQIVEKVAAGILPRDSGISQLVFFFQLTPDQAEQVMGAAGTPGFTPAGTTLNVTEQAGTAPAEENVQAQVGSGEYKEVSRQQWNRNRKAISDVLTDFAEKKQSRTVSEVMLSGLGLSPENVQRLLDDASDGTVDETLPEGQC